MRPGPNAASDEALVDYLRATGATAYHPVGTCRIGTDAAQSVVDPQLRVHGMQGLRVADGVGDADASPPPTPMRSASSSASAWPTSSAATQADAVPSAPVC